MLEHSLNLVVDILSCEAELLIKHCVRCRETEALKTEYLTVVSYETLEVNWKTSCKTEDLSAARENLLLVLLRLAAEETL